LGELGSQHEIIRRAWIEEYKKMIEASQKLEIKKLVVHPHIKSYKKTGKPFDKKFLDSNVESLTEINDYANDHGVVVVIENEPRKDNVFSFDDYKVL